MSAPVLTGAQLAEQAGGQIAREMVNALWTSKDQAEAVRHLMDGLESAFNPDGDLIVRAVSGGFSVGIVNILERGLSAIRADGTEDKQC